MKNKDITGPIILSLLFVFIIIAGIISYQNIDWTILQRVEKQKLILPTPIVSNITNVSTSPATSTPSSAKK
jgi:hypothetical protein